MVAIADHVVLGIDDARIAARRRLADQQAASDAEQDHRSADEYTDHQQHGEHCDADEAETHPQQRMARLARREHRAHAGGVESGVQIAEEGVGHGLQKTS